MSKQDFYLGDKFRSVHFMRALFCNILVFDLNQVLEILNIK